MDADSARDQSNLNMACLRSAVKLLDNLELKALDGAIGDDSVHVVSRLYIRYSGILLKSLDCCQLGLSVSSIHSPSSGVLVEGSLQASDSISDVPSLQKVSYCTSPYGVT